MNPCILVFGMPRSGTTWIGKLFDSHPDTLYRHEPDSVMRLSLPLYPEVEDAPRHREELEQFVASMPRLRSPEVVGKQPLFPKSYQSAAGLAVYRASVVAAKAASRIRRHFPCLYRPAAMTGDRARLVWKSIESPGRLGVCIKALPSARAIHLMRHPCGYVASVLRGEALHRFSDRNPSADQLWVLKLLLATASGKRRGLNLDDIKRLSPEEHLAWRWVLTQEKILTDVTGNERVLTVRYEDVCADPIEMTRRMVEFAGLDWQAQTERFVLASTHAGGSDYYSVFKNPRTSAERWRSELDSKVIDRVLKILGTSPLRDFYGEGATTPPVITEAVS
ncbi:MAG TPA: sulfotransferase [Rhodanobacteraceae bacterium]|nr:sulfotransferase [Rhodanobacteraceae bacterium]